MTMTPETTTNTAILRPSRRPLLFMAPLVSAEVVLVVALVFSRALEFERAVLSLVALFIPLGLLVVALVTRPLRYVLIMLSGHTEVGPDALVNRTVAGSSRMKWQEIKSVEVCRSLFGRKVFAVLKKRRRRRVFLAAPRDGLLASALFLTRPWLDPWWPGRQEVTRTPHACDIPGIGSLVPALHEVAGFYSSKAGESSCTWGMDTTNQEGDPRLTVRLNWVGRTFIQDAERNAHDDFTRRLDGERYKPVPGLGDEAAESFTSPDSSGVWGDVIVRRANVVIRISYGAEQPADQVVPTAQRLAHVITDQLPVD